MAAGFLKPDCFDKLNPDIPICCARNCKNKAVKVEYIEPSKSDIEIGFKNPYPIPLCEIHNLEDFIEKCPTCGEIPNTDETSGCEDPIGCSKVK